MRWLVSVLVVLASAAPALADVPLPSRDLIFPPFAIADLEPVSFDLFDFRAEQKLPPPVAEVEPRSIWNIKRHIGASVGYDSGVFHGSVGLYLTMAEWGRWNYGAPAVELGFGRYHRYDAKSGESYTSSDTTIMISLVSIHYRVGYIQSWGVNCYINLEQVFDMRDSMPGSQFGFSFSRK